MSPQKMPEPMNRSGEGENKDTWITSLRSRPQPVAEKCQSCQMIDLTSRSERQANDDVHLLYIGNLHLGRKYIG